MRDVQLLPSARSTPAHEGVLTSPALGLVAELTRTFRPKLLELLGARRTRQAELDAGARLDFLPSTREVREAAWQVAPLPPDLHDRRVEITGPVDRKMIINALGSGAKVFMADFEDSSSPTWDAMVLGQHHLRDAIARTITFDDPTSGKHYTLPSGPLAVLMVRPRGLHLWEGHVRVDDAPVPAGLFDAVLYLAHNAHALRARGTGAYFYLPKMQSHLEARWWNEVLNAAERALHLSVGSSRATVLIETLPAAFEMDEILYELRGRSAGLNCGRWDYIFSSIKTRRLDADFVLPDRAQVGMTQPCMRAYADLLVRTCHRRGVHAMGGMAAQIPIKGDPAANEAALEKVRADKRREVQAGHDGTWVAHPALVPVAQAIFDEGMPGPNQIERARDDVQVSARELLAPPQGTRTEAGLRQNLEVGVQYLAAWLSGVGCVPLHHLMEDAATAEISRTQIWQWQHHQATLDDGRVVDAELVRATLTQEMAALRARLGDVRWREGHFDAAQEMFARLALSSELEEFLTVPAYEALLARGL